MVPWSAAFGVFDFLDRMLNRLPGFGDLKKFIIHKEPI
jgi:hypothetical protein